MARQTRTVIPGCPHHVTHRGNLHAQVFLSKDDRTALYPGSFQSAQQALVDLLTPGSTWELETGKALSKQKPGRCARGVANVIDLTEDLFG